ncbi:methyl-accepting chemotaxis protein [Psychrobium sp. 1_MG-2023]|uniref:methyl-accepting chemotaxis protein n=1 Tax=Psychrobium sp. 1_MG-2023 TaxID=3062624 RepID=UPI000C320046|nr:HAMP domain-containing methyl-accepting chemotaxis protein [Psychrobium sp. 1_MG-2023]MDP2559887.1 HAMP domain-containing methyl-accepting chemotaxis protein [Psychrobium sp. 1_MG-2023]PKF59012.1 hypothetical protein CW748_02145 [Alteromonadales bacterium alter-6D02]
MFRQIKIKNRMFSLGLSVTLVLVLLGTLAVSAINAILTQIEIDNRLVDVNKLMYQARLGQADYIITGEKRFLTINREKAALALKTASELKQQMAVESSITQMKRAISSIEAYNKAVELAFRDSHLPSNANTQTMLSAAQKVTDIISKLSDAEEKIALQTVDSQKSTLTFITIFALLLIVTALFLIVRSVIEPLNNLEKKFKYVADSSNLSASADTSGQDEISNIAISFNAMLNSFSETLRTVQENVLNTSSQALVMTDRAIDGSEVISHQQVQLEDLAASMNEMALSSKEVAQHAELMAQMSQESQLEAAAGQQQMALTMDNIQQAASEISRADVIVQELKDGVLQIGDIAEVIRGISEQTNLLALNAAIEAARAGEQGRGFAVVADEVRTLAARTQQSTQEIKSTIDNLQLNAVNAADAMQESQTQMEQCVSSSDNTSQELTKIVEKLEQTNEMVAGIATSAEQQNSVSEQASANIREISSVSQGVTESSVSLANDSRAMASEASVLRESLDKFKF